MTDWQLYRLLAAHLLDIYEALNARIVNAKGHHPVWKVSDIADAEGRIVEKITDELQPLRALQEKIDALGKDAFQLALTRKEEADI